MSICYALVVFCVFFASGAAQDTNAASFKLGSVGQKAVFDFKGSDWDVLFGDLSLRQLNTTLGSIMDLVRTLQSDVRAAKAEAASAKEESSLLLQKLDMFMQTQKVCL